MRGWLIHTASVKCAFASGTSSPPSLRSSDHLGIGRIWRPSPFSIIATALDLIQDLPQLPHSRYEESQLAAGKLNLTARHIQPAASGPYRRATRPLITVSSGYESASPMYRTV